MRLRPSPLTTCALPLLALVLSLTCVALAHAQRKTDPAALESLARQYRAQMAARQGAPYQRLIARTDGPQGTLNRRPDLRLMFLDERGVPRFYTTTNLSAAGTVNTDDVWPGGSTGYGLSGAGTALGELGEWDAGGVRTTHQELTGRVTQMDVTGGPSDHATHVAGTMIASGVLAAARGMSFEGTLAAYDWGDDAAEMAAAAAGGMLASNHSYAFVAGWYFNWDGSGNWFWFGDTTLSATEDYGFGYYDVTAQTWDQMAVDAPNYLIVKAAGNDRSNFGPAQPDSHYIWDSGLEDWVWSMTVRNPDGAPEGYDSIPWHGVAKNILTVGAVFDIPGGWTAASDVAISWFSSWGPADDGRIKPDIVANGVELTSCLATSNGAYDSYNGTSMATPNTTGSINLLNHHYRAEHAGATPRSATMKAVLVHTANEAGGFDGPDYRHGWGLLNTSGAADLITADTARIIREETLADAATDVYVIQHPGGDLRVTIAWTDPPGTPPAPQLDPADPMLVNDLDLRVEAHAVAGAPAGDPSIGMPWALDPANPANAATRGDNTRDNVEQVVLPAAAPGLYSVFVRHKGALVNGAQDYSIVASGELEPPEIVGVDAAAGAAGFAIAGAYPNPFVAGTRIELVLPARGAVEVGVYDLGGRRVRDLDRSLREAGRHVLTWDGRDERGARLPAGIYFLRAAADGAERVQRLILLD